MGRRLIGGCGCFGVLAAVAMLWGGGQGVYTALNNPEPVEMTCTEYLERRPDALWLRLTGCELSLPEAAYAGWGATPDALYVPMRPRTAEGIDGPVAMVLVTEDAELRAEMSKLLELDEQAEMDEIRAYLEAHTNEVFPARTVEGLVQFGIELDSEERSDVQRLIDDLTGDFVMIEEGARPRMGFSLAMTGGGLLILLAAGVGAIVLVRQARSETGGSEGAAPAGGAGEADASAGATSAEPPAGGGPIQPK